MSGQRFVVAITGASGSEYALRLIEILVEAGHEAYVVVSGGGLTTLRHEVEPERLHQVLSLATEVFDDADIGASIASGSFVFDGLAVVPCSMNSLARLHAHLADTLITRAALVAMKERRRLVVVPREMPMATGTLEQMARLSQLGVIIAPASPGFYHRPQSMAELVEFVAAKTAACLGVRSWRLKAWKANQLCDT